MARGLSEGGRSAAALEIEGEVMVRDGSMDSQSAHRGQFVTGAELNAVEPVENIARDITALHAGFDQLH